MKRLQKKLAEFNKPQLAKKLGIYPFYQILESSQDTEVIIKGENKLMFGSNSYLGLNKHPLIVDASINAIRKYGTGASGSRPMNGNMDIHEELDEKLAKFVNKPAATVFSTGFQTNLGVISCLLGRNDLIIIDEKCHASIIEGCRLSFAKTLKYRHADMDSLEKLLKLSNPERICLVITDGIFSMDGDIADLEGICRLTTKYKASLMVDDAHALGVIGEHGSGTASHFKLTNQTDLIVGTFSKSFVSLGGFAAGDADTINFIKHHARSLLFSASIPPASAATVLKALEIIYDEPERITNLWDNTRYASNRLQQEGFDIGKSETPIIPILIGDNNKTYSYYTWLFNNGLYVNPVVHPAVDKDKGILRFSLMATHSKDQIDLAIDKLVKCRNIIEEMSPVLI